MSIRVPPRRMRVLQAAILLTLPLLFVAADARNWESVLRFCHAFWASVIHSGGMITLHLLLVALAAWVILRLLQFCLSEAAARRHWRRFLAAHKTTVIDRTCGGAWLVDSDVSFAFTAGWVHPRTYLSTGLKRQLTNEEFRAVMSHESHHRSRHDPARILFWKLSASLFPMLPLIGAFARAALSEYECDADRASERKGVSRATLFSAIRRTVALGGTLPVSHAASFAVAADLAVRVRLLRGERIARPGTVRAALITVTSLVVFALPPVVMRDGHAYAYHMVQCDAPHAQPAQRAPMSAPSSFAPLVPARASFASVGSNPGGSISSLVSLMSGPHAH